MTPQILKGLSADWRYAWRRLRRAPLFTFFGVVTLGFGIGATTGVYSTISAVLGPPPGVPNVDRIVNVYHSRGGGSSQSFGFSLPDYLDLRARQTVFDQLTAWTFLQMAYSANGQTGTSFGELVGGEYFATLGLTPERGRLLQPADDRPDAPPAVVISHGMWQRVFAGADDVIGKSVKINGQPFEVVGVAPRTFHGLFNNGLVQSVAWAPVASARTIYRRDVNDREARFLFAKGILKPGRTLDDARAELAALGQQLDREYPLGLTRDSRRLLSYERSRAWHALAMADVRVNESDATIVNVLMGALMLSVGAVLLVACSNLANLSLARGSGRQQEMAVRLALGAPRWRLVRESLTESLILATMGGALAVGVAKALIVVASERIAVSGSAAVLQVQPRLDFDVLLVAVATTMLALIVAGLAPALQSAGTDVRSGLAAETSQGVAPRWRGRQRLVAAQVMVSVILLGLAAVAAVQLRSIQREDHGFALNDLAVADVDFDAQRYDPARIERTIDMFLAQMSSRPEAAGVTVATGLPKGSLSRRGSVAAADGDKPRNTEIIAGHANMLAAFGNRLLSGRAWDARDLGNPQVAVLDDWTARTMFGSAPAVGQTIALKVGKDPVQTRTVIGVVADAWPSGPFRSRPATVYVPFNRDYGTRLVFVARANGNPGALVGLLQKTLRGIDPELVARVGTGPEIVGTNAQFFQITAGAASLLGGFAWALAIAGLFGVLSHLVLRRTREIGIRVALGATRDDITRMIVREGLSPVAVGVVAGLALGVVFRLALAARFFTLPPAIDFVVLAVAPLPFLAAAFLACYIPARRAASVRPNTALRHT